MRVARYIRQHHIGLIALFIALTGTAYAGTQVASHGANPQASKAKKKKVKRGPAGPPGQAGPQGPKGDTGQSGSPAASINTGIVQVSGGFDGFGTPSGFSSGSATEENVQSRTPSGSSVTARDLSLSLPSAYSIPSGITAKGTLHVNGADTALSCNIPIGGNACQDSSDAVTIPPNTPISMHIQFFGSGTFGTSQWAFGWRAIP